MLSTFLMHFAAPFVQALLVPGDISCVPAIAAAVPTARPMPMPLMMLFLEEANIFIPPIRYYNKAIPHNYCLTAVNCTVLTLIFYPERAIKIMPILFKEVIKCQI